MACSKSSRKTEGSIINALDLDIVIAKILEYLPIRIAAQASVLSKQWRRSWLSLRSLVFDGDFYDEICDNNEEDTNHYTKENWCKWSSIICNVLLYHNGPIDYFELWNFFNETKTGCITHSHCLSFASKHGVKKISINNCYSTFDISPYIFCCSELVHLRLRDYRLSYTPSDFCGFRNLKHLELIYINFCQKNTLLSLVANCSMLAYLRLESCKGMKNIVIDIPSLKTLIIRGVRLESIAFRNVHSLEYISLKTYNNVELIGADNLANSCQLQSIEFDGSVCKFLMAGGISRSLPVEFNYLNKLYLIPLELSDFGVFGSVLCMLENCPYITILQMSLCDTVGEAFNQHELDYNYSYKLAHLLEIKIDSMTGSSAEFKLIEHLFAISTVLEKLSFTYCYGCKSQLKIAKALMEFPRASTKARLVCLDQ